MKPFAVAALTAALSLVATMPAAQAEPQPAKAPADACTSAATWVQGVKQHSEGMSVLVLSDVAGQEAQAIVARINAMPPETDLRADHLIVLGARADATNALAPYVLVAFFNHDCLVTSGRADPRDTVQMLQGESI